MPTPAGVTGGADRRRQRPRPLQEAQQRHDDQEVGEVVGRRQLADDDEVAFRRIGADVAQHEAVDDEDPEELLVDRPEARAAHRRAVEPGQEQQDDDRAEHGEDADQLRRDQPPEQVEGDRPQDRVERQEVPFRHDVRRRHHRVRLDVVVRLAEEVGREEDEAEIDEHEHAQPEHVLDGVVGRERDGVLRPLDVDAERVVGLRGVQRHQMQEHQREDDERQQVVQREEAVQRRRCRPRSRPTAR